MIRKLKLWFFGIKNEWEEYERVEKKNGIHILFLCKVTGNFKRIYLGG